MSRLNDWEEYEKLIDICDKDCIPYPPELCEYLNEMVGKEDDDG